MGILESKREQIIGSDEMIAFGAAIKDMDPPKRIVGVKIGRPDSSRGKQLKDTYGLIRRPAGFKTNISAKLMSVDGFIPNATLAIVHFILILVVPVFTPVITFLAIAEMTKLQGDVYARPISFYDFYSTNRLDPWWVTTPYIDIAAYIHIYVLVYLFFAYVELLSFYLTGLDNQGKFPVQYTWVKRFFMLSFYLSILVFLFLYLAMLVFALVWAVLAAILNPSVFLPYTTAALTLIATCTSKYVYFKTKLMNLRKNFD